MKASCNQTCDQRSEYPLRSFPCVLHCSLNLPLVRLEFAKLEPTLGHINMRGDGAQIKTCKISSTFQSAVPAEWACSTRCSVHSTSMQQGGTVARRLWKSPARKSALKGWDGTCDRPRLGLREMRLEGRTRPTGLSSELHSPSQEDYLLTPNDPHGPPSRDFR